MLARLVRTVSFWMLMVLALVSAAPAGASDQQTAANGGVGTPPRQLRITTIGVSAEIVPVALTSDGEMEVPADPDAVGWYTLGPGIAGAGNMILTGHVDWAGRLRVFGGLSRLRQGDEIVLTDVDGLEHRFEVTWTRQISADDPPWEEIFSQGTQREVTLITCTGPFDRQRREYLERLVVRARHVAKAA